MVRYPSLRGRFASAREGGKLDQAQRYSDDRPRRTSRRVERQPWEEAEEDTRLSPYLKS